MKQKDTDKMERPPHRPGEERDEDPSHESTPSAAKASHVTSASPPAMVVTAQPVDALPESTPHAPSGESPARPPSDPRNPPGSSAEPPPPPPSNPAEQTQIAETLLDIIADVLTRLPDPHHDSIIHSYQLETHFQFRMTVRPADDPDQREVAREQLRREVEKEVRKEMENSDERRRSILQAVLYVLRGDWLLEGWDFFQDLFF
jgi:hypothetical protein